MKTVSLSALALALALVGVMPAAYAQSTAESKTERGNRIQLADNAPDSYTVVKGDTLWGISGKFLKSPWRWPEVWKLNKEEIRNPHWIYPGQTIYLDRQNMTLSLKPPGVGSDAGFVRVSPKVYESDLGAAIASVPLQNIQSFLVEPLFLETTEPAGAATVIGVQENRVMAATSETFFARGLGAGAQDNWSVFRPGAAIKDPTTGQVLGYEAVFVANGRVKTSERPPVAAALVATRVKHQITAGDHLLPTAKETNFSYVPRAAPADLNAKIASIYGGVNVTGVHGVVTINAGRNSGLEPGHVMALNRSLGSVAYRGPDGGKKAEMIPLPDERYGLAFVFRVFDKLSYAYILESSREVIVGDRVAAP